MPAWGSKPGSYQGVAGVSSCWKGEGPRKRCPQGTQAAKDTPAHEELSFETQTDWLPPCSPSQFTYTSSLPDSALHSQHGSSPPQATISRNICSTPRHVRHWFSRCLLIQSDNHHYNNRNHLADRRLMRRHLACLNERPELRRIWNSGVGPNYKEPASRLCTPKSLKTAKLQTEVQNN